MLLRKRARSSTPAGESASSEVPHTALQAAMREIRQLQEERIRQQADFEARLQQRDEVLQELQERLQQNELSQFNNRESAAGINRDSLNRELGFELKPDIFDGTVPLREFLSQFEMIARTNRWSDALKTVALVSSLRGKARAVLECVQLETLNFGELKSKLELRFGDSYLSQSYYSIFTNRRQKSGEDEAALGTDVERLSQLAYPECSHEVRDKIACAQFITALSNGFIKRTLQLEGITSLKAAVHRAMAVKIIQENSFSKDNKFQQRDFKFNKFNGEKNNFKRKIGELEKNGNNNEKRWPSSNKNSNKEFYERKGQQRKECWKCGALGHFRFECPSKTTGNAN